MSAQLGVGTPVDPRRVVGERWFASKERPVSGVTVEERFAIGGNALAILRVDLSGSRPVRYTFPLEDEQAMWRELAEIAGRGGPIRGEAGGSLVGIPPVVGRGKRALMAAPGGAAPHAPTVRPLGIDQSHSSVVIDEALVLKLYRRLEPGPNPEVELVRALAEAPIPTFEGAITYHPGPRAEGERRGRPIDIAVVQRFVPGAIDEFERLAEAMAAWLRTGATPSGRDVLLEGLDPAGRSVAALHVAMLRLRGRALGPRAARQADATRWSARARRALPTAIRALARIDPELAADLRGRGSAVQLALAPLASLPTETMLSRIHGDLHLGQLIRDGSRFLIVDLEGEPTGSVSDRRRPDAPLRDVASMLRSFDHIARSAIRRAETGRGVPEIEEWIVMARRTFLTAYLDDLSSRGTEIHVDLTLLHALEVEKELYEFTYAARYLPAWRYAPAAGLRWLLEHAPEVSDARRRTPASP